MATVAQTVKPLSMGDRLTREEFLRLWEEHPEIKRAELIGRTVYMPAPVSFAHGDEENLLGFWACHYRMATPGTMASNNATTLLLEDCLQPDVHLRILPEYGGLCQHGDDGLLHGPPEWTAEVCKSSAAYDLHQKLELYERAGVLEYLTVLLYEQEIRWHVLVDGQFQLMPPGADGIGRSRVFPGLWLDGAALLRGDAVRVLAKLQEGIASPEHQAFVTQLAQRRRGSASR